MSPAGGGLQTRSSSNNLLRIFIRERFTSTLVRSKASGEHK